MHPQILAVELSGDATKVFAGGIDNCVQVWDLAKGGSEGPVDIYEGHADSITGLRLSPDGCVGSVVGWVGLVGSVWCRVAYLLTCT